LRRIVGAEEVHEIDDEVKPGEEVEIAGGAFHGLKAVVSQVMPGSRRVVVLLDFLGRQSAVQVPSASIVRSGFRR
jgi:transcription antitermination factor NusG